MTPISLAIDGANPLGFLAALGTAQLLATAAGTRHAAHVRLEWTATRTPILRAGGVDDSEALVHMLADLARRPAAEAAAVAQEKATRASFDVARRAERRKRDEIKNRRLAREQARLALEAEHAPLALDAQRLRATWRDARARAVPDPSVSMGLDLNVNSEEFRDHCRDALDSTTPSERHWVDFCACFGVESARERMHATPFALLRGTSHQHFLGTAGDLMVCCAAEHIREVLFGAWAPKDEGRSFRWDPADDRRYALMASDPSPNKPKTIWGANRLAFEALRLFPCMPARARALTIGWRRKADAEMWRWPLWECELSPAVISSVLASSDVWRDTPEARRRLRARGVFAVFQTERIAVGSGQSKQLNLTPATPVWATTPSSCDGSRSGSR